MGLRKSIALNIVYREVGLYTSKIDHSSNDYYYHDVFRITVTCFGTIANKLDRFRSSCSVRSVGRIENILLSFLDAIYFRFKNDFLF